MDNGFSGLDQIDDLVQKLTRMGKEIDGRTRDKAVLAGAEKAKDLIERHPNVPVSNSNKEHAKDNFIVMRAKNGVYEVGPSKDFYYLLFHEIGTQGGTYKSPQGKSFSLPPLPAKPFMRPAFENGKRQIEAAMIKVIKREMNLP